MNRAGGARLLVVEDDPTMGRALRTNLTRHGFQVEVAGTGGRAIEAVDTFRPDLILLDLGLPDMDGAEVIRTVRELTATPIIVLTARDAEREKVRALDTGADDYLTKPFGVEELLARVRVGLRHAARLSAGRPVFRTGDLEVDLEHRRVGVAGREIHLTPTEYDLLKAFVAHPNRVLTERMLLEQVWSGRYGAESHYLHVYVARLRKKIEPDPQHPRYLRTEPGVGYRLIADDA